jgi:hypothetical protein
MNIPNWYEQGRVTVDDIGDLAVDHHRHWYFLSEPMDKLTGKVTGPFQIGDSFLCVEDQLFAACVWEDGTPCEMGPGMYVYHMQPVATVEDDPFLDDAMVSFLESLL